MEKAENERRQLNKDEIRGGKNSFLLYVTK